MAGGLSCLKVVMTLRHWWRWLTIVIGSLVWLGLMTVVYYLFTVLPALLMLVFWLLFLASQIWGSHVNPDRWSRMEDDDRTLEKNQKQ